MNNHVVSSKYAWGPPKHSGIVYRTIFTGRLYNAVRQIWLIMPLSSDRADWNPFFEMSKHQQTQHGMAWFLQHVYSSKNSTSSAYTGWYQLQWKSDCHTMTKSIHTHLNMPVTRKNRFWPLKSLSTSFTFHSFTVKIQRQPRLSWGTVLEEVSENILSPLWSTPEAGTARIQVRKGMKIVDVQWFECML